MHLVDQTLVTKHAARRRAALPSGADRAEHDRRDRQIEVGVVHDEQRVVATALQDRLAIAARDLGTDDLADRRRPRERDQRQALVRHHRLADFFVAADDQARERAEALLFEDRTTDVRQADRGQRCLRARLPDARVAADVGQHRVPGPDGHREVERGDDSDGPERVPLFTHRVTGTLGVHRESVQHARLSDREVGDVDALLDLAPTLLRDLAHLERDQATERILLRTHRLAHPSHDLAALGGRHFAPTPEGLFGRGDNLFVVGACGLPNGRQELARRGALALEQPARRREPLAAVGAGVLGLDSELAQELLMVLEGGRHGSCPVAGGGDKKWGEGG